jgi:hypothetical protein
MAFALYAASFATLCVALYECDRRAESLTASAAGSLLFAVLSIIPFLCLLMAGWGAYFSLVRAKRAGGVLAANLSVLAQIVVLITAVPLILFCSVVQVPAVPVALSQGARMFRTGSIPASPQNAPVPALIPSSLAASGYYFPAPNWVSTRARKLSGTPRVRTKNIRVTWLQTGLTRASFVGLCV